MGLRRRRRQLTTLLTNIDRRLRNVERRRAPKLIFPQAITAESIADGSITEDKLAVDSTGVDANTGFKTPDVPTYFIGITSAKMDDSGSFSIPATCTINLNADHNFEVGNKVIITGTVYYDGTWKVDTVPSSTSFTFKREYWNGGLGNQPLTTQSVAITNKVCTTTVATITTGSAHNFQVDDEVYITGLDAPFDGVFTVASVPDSTSFMYKFITAQTAVVSTADSGVAYPVVIKYGKVGDTWVDTTDQSVYAWTGLRWELVNGGIPEDLFIPDDIAPKAPTSLVLTSDGYFSNGEPKASINVTWVAPTQNVDDTPLTDLLGYEVYYKYNSAKKWVLADSVSVGESLEGEILDLPQATLVYVSVRAYDSSGNRSAYARISEGVLYSITTDTSALELSTPTTPVVNSRLGTISVTWDGQLSGGAPGKSFSHIEVHMSTSSTFTPTTSTLVGKLFGAGDFIIGGTDLSYSTTYYFKFVAVDTSGNKTNASSAASSSVSPLVNNDIIANTISGAKITNGTITASDKIIGNTITGALIQAQAVQAVHIQANAIEADMISVGALDGQIITGAVIRTSSSNPKLIMNTSGLYALNSGGTAVVTLEPGLFSMSANTSSGVGLQLRSTNPVIGISQRDGVITAVGTSYRTSFDANDIQTYTTGSLVNVGGVLQYTRAELNIQRYGGGLNIGSPSYGSNTTINGNLTVTGSISGSFSIPSPLRLSDGSVGSPTYSFSNDTDTGVYSYGAGVVGIASNGAVAARFGSGNIYLTATDTNITGTLNVTGTSFLEVANASRFVTVSSADNSYLNIASTDTAYTSDMIVLSSTDSDGANYNFGEYRTIIGNVTDVKFRFKANGQMLSDTASGTPAADYAEYFEWEDGNILEEDRVGLSVVLAGEKIREAALGETPIGVVSAVPAFIGDNAWNHWKDKYLKDDYGRTLVEKYNVIYWYDENGIKHSYPEDSVPEGVDVPEDYIILEKEKKVINPEYDNDIVYVPREDRPEWSPVGLVGKLRVRKGQEINPNWIKLRNISDTVEEWFIR